MPHQIIDGPLLCVTLVLHGAHPASVYMSVHVQNHMPHNSPSGNYLSLVTFYMSIYAIFDNSITTPHNKKCLLYRQFWIHQQERD